MQHNTFKHPDILFEIKFSGSQCYSFKIQKENLKQKHQHQQSFPQWSFLFQTVLEEKNQQRIVFPGIFSIKFQCFMCKQITFQCCSIGNLVQSTKIKIIQKILAMVHFHQPRFTIRDVVPSFLSWGFIWIWKRDFKGENQVEMTFFQCCTEFTISREAWHSCFMRFCRWKMPKSEVNTDHNENLFIKILLGSRQCASSFTTISW